MKKIIKVFLFVAVLSLFHAFYVSADTTDSFDAWPRAVYEDNGVVYSASKDKNGNWYYSVERMETGLPWLESYVVRKEIDGIPVKSITFMDAIGKLILHNNIERIENCAFRETGLTEIDIPDSVKYIGNLAFSQSRLKKVTIGNGIPVLRGGIVTECRYLEEIVIKDGVKEIGGGAFTWNDNIKKITIPPSVTSIALSSFNTGLKDVTIYGYENSYAEQWAKVMGYRFKSLGTVEKTTNSLPVIATPQVNGNQLTVSVANPEDATWDGWCYRITRMNEYLDEDLGMHYPALSHLYRIHTDKPEPVTFKYLPRGSYYIVCVEYRETEYGKEYGEIGIPVVAKVTSRLTKAPSFVKAKITKGKNGTRNLTVTVKNKKKVPYDCVLGKTTVSSVLCERIVNSSVYKNYKETKPADYAYVKKNLTSTEIVFKNVKPGTYYFSAHGFERYDGKKAFGEWSVPVGIVIK